MTAFVIPDSFVDLYADTPNEELILKFGVSERTIMRWRNKTGARKSKTYLSKLAKERRTSTVFPKGEKHYNWKGGKPWKRFADPRYISWRNLVLERDNFICQDCDENFATRGRWLHAHHLKSYKEYPNLRLELSNGVTLCKWCHMKRHKKELIREKIMCACGCGAIIDKYDVHNRERRYVNRHARRKKIVF
jgi:hypothetical protein